MSKLENSKIEFWDPQKMGPQTLELKLETPPVDLHCNNQNTNRGINQMALLWMEESE